MTLTFRPALRGDIDTLGAIAEATDLFPATMLPDMIDGYLTGGPDRWLVAEDGAPVAFCFLSPERMTENTWNMLALAVRPDRQGQGIGAALVAAAEEALRDAGGRILIVETAGTEDFARTRAFYAGLDYAEQGRVTDFYLDGWDKVIFWKRL